MYLIFVDYFIVLLVLLPFSKCRPDCYGPRTSNQLPLLAHCRELIAAINHASHLPGRNYVKTWGRGLPNGGMTENLPYANLEVISSKASHH